MEIPSFMFIVIGIVMTMISFFVGERISGMYVFIIPGIGFIVWGLFKMLKKGVSKKFGSSNIKEINKINSSDKNPFNAQDNTSSQEIASCPSCGLKHYSHANFCQRCGTKLK